MEIGLSPKIGLDMGTGKTVLWAGKKIIYNEPTALIVDPGRNKVLYTGRRAAERSGDRKTGYEILRPVRRGSIADYAGAVFLLKKTLSIAMKVRVLKPLIVASTPIEISSVETRALCDAAREAGAGAIYLLPCNLASSWSCGERPDDPAVTLVVDIGAGGTDISVIASNQIVTGRTVPLGGDDITELARRVMEVSYGVRMGRPDAERLKMDVGVEYYGDERIEKIRRGPEGESDYKKIGIPRKQVAEYLLKGLDPLFAGIAATLEETPPELFEDIFTRGIMLTGGGALLPGLGKRVQERMRLNVNRLPEPSLSVIRGIGKALEGFSRYREYFLGREAV